MTSLVIAVSVAATAFRPPNVYDGGNVVIAGDSIEIGSYFGRIDLRYTRGVDCMPGYRRLAAWRDSLPQPVTYSGDTTYAVRHLRCDAGIWDGGGGRTGTWWSVGLNRWYLVAAAMILPARSAWRWTRRNRSATGHCPVCDYDLRATPDRRPECGTAFGPLAH